MSGSTLRTGKRAEPDAAARQDAHRLAALARDSAAAGIRRRCLVLRLSTLPAELRKPHHLRLAGEALDPLLSADRAQRFVLPNHDIATVWRGSAEALLDASRQAVAQVFADSAAAVADPGGLWRLLELPDASETLCEMVAHSLRDVTAPQDDGPKLPLDAAALAALEDALAQADVARFVRRRMVCSPATDGRFRLAWEVRSLAADAVCADLAPGRTAQAEPWLAARLARTLDRRLLALLADPRELHGAGPFGLDLNVTSMLGPEFLRFDAALPQALRGRVVVGLQPADLLADLPAFLFARDFARARGYRLLLRLPGCGLLPVLPIARLGLDLAELGWSPAAITLPADLLEAMAERLLLGGADTAEALLWGRAHGIALFAGRAVAPGAPAR